MIDFSENIFVFSEAACEKGGSDKPHADIIF